MAGDGWLNAENVRQFLDEVDKEPGHGRGKVEMYVAGGARMLLGLRDNRSTNDIDGVIREGHGRLIEASRRVGRRHNIGDNWMNEEMSLSLPRKRDSGEVTLYTGNRLVIRGASKKHMLAMKLHAHRAVDISDAAAIVDLMEIHDTATAQKIAEDVYETEGWKAKQTIHRGLDLLADARPDLTRNHEPRPHGEELKPPRTPDKGTTKQSEETYPVQGQGLSAGGVPTEAKQTKNEGRDPGKKGPGG